MAYHRISYHFILYYIITYLIILHLIITYQIILYHITSHKIKSYNTIPKFHHESSHRLKHEEIIFYILCSNTLFPVRNISSLILSHNPLPSLLLSLSRFSLSLSILSTTLLKHWLPFLLDYNSR